MAEQVIELARANAGVIEFAGTTCPSVSTVRVQIDDGPLRVAFEPNVLSVSGGAKEIALFAGNMPIEATLKSGYHVHLEHAGREWFVASDSLPLVMIVQ